MMGIPQRTEKFPDLEVFLSTGLDVNVADASYEEPGLTPVMSLYSCAFAFA